MRRTKAIESRGPVSCSLPATSWAYGRLEDVLHTLTRVILATHVQRRDLRCARLAFLLGSAWHCSEPSKSLKAVSGSRASEVRCYGPFWYITVRFSKFFRFVLLRDIMAAVVFNAFLDHSLYAYDSPADVFTGKGRHFGAKLIHAVCAMLGSYALFHDCLTPPDE